MEMVYRRIEYAIEGDWKQQKALNNGPMTNAKMGKKALKHVLFFTISFLIGNLFLMYILGSDEVFRIVRFCVAPSRLLNQLRHASLHTMISRSISRARKYGAARMRSHCLPRSIAFCFNLPIILARY